MTVWYLLRTLNVTLAIAILFSQLLQPVAEAIYGWHYFGYLVIAVVFFGYLFSSPPELIAENIEPLTLRVNYIVFSCISVLGYFLAWVWLAHDGATFGDLIMGAVIIFSAENYLRRYLRLVPQP